MPRRRSCGPDHVWSRTEVLDWLLAAAREGADPVRLRLQLRPADRRARRISARARPACRRTAQSLLGLCRRRLRRRGSRRGELPRARPSPPFLFRRRRRREARLPPLPRCERGFNAHRRRQGPTVYDAIGAAQVAKASFAGMRLLHRLDGGSPIWPFDPAARARQRGRRNLHRASICAAPACAAEGAVARRAQPRAGGASAARPRACASSRTTTRPTR